MAAATETTGRRPEGTGERALAVRPLLAGDLAAVVELHVASFRVQSSRRFLARAYYPAFLERGSTGFGLVATDGPRLSGFLVGALDDRAFHRVLVRQHPLECALALARRMTAGGGRGARRVVARAAAELPEARFHYLATAPTARGSGLGRRLLASGLELVAARGATSCATRIYDDNGPSRRLFESLGARRADEGGDTIGPFADYRFGLTPAAASRAATSASPAPPRGG